MISGIVERVVGRLKGDPDYRLQSTYSWRELATIVLWRVAQIARGLRMKVVLKASRGTVFCGRRVVVQHGYRVIAGCSLILEDGAFLDGLSSDGINLGDHVTVGRDAVIVCTGVIARRGVGVWIGDRSAVGAQSFIGGQGGVRIGSDVIMGPGVRIFSENHSYADPTVPIRLQGEVRSEVTIENDCWIGAGVTILAGVAIGRGCVVAAGAVVTKSVANFIVVGGIPARPIGQRSPTVPQMQSVPTLVSNTQLQKGE